MKLLIIGLLFSFSLSAQTLDTVRVRNLSLQAQDWAWLVGKLSGQINRDSLSIVAFRKIRQAAQNAGQVQWTTNVNIDSLPGSVVVAFYQTAKTAAAGEIVNRYTAITGAISAKAVLSYWVGLLDGVIGSDFTRYRDLGKNIILD
jgi:hypothetical protein